MRRTLKKIDFLLRIRLITYDGQKRNNIFSVITGKISNIKTTWCFQLCLNTLKNSNIHKFLINKFILIFIEQLIISLNHPFYPTHFLKS